MDFFTLPDIHLPRALPHRHRLIEAMVIVQQASKWVVPDRITSIGFAPSSAYPEIVGGRRHPGRAHHRRMLSAD